MADFLWKQASTDEYELILDNGKAVIVDGQYARLLNNAGEVVVDIPIGLNFEEAQPILLAMLYELDGENLVNQQVAILDRFADELPQVSHGNHIKRLKSIREWLLSGKRQPIQELREIPNLRWQVYTFTWNEQKPSGSTLIFSTDTTHGEVHIEEYAARPGVVGGTSHYRLKVIDPYSGAILKEPRQWYDWQEAELRLRELLFLLDLTQVDESLYLCLEFSINICSALLETESNLVDTSRLDHLKSHLLDRL